MCVDVLGAGVTGVGAGCSTGGFGVGVAGHKIRSIGVTHTRRDRYTTVPRSMFFTFPSGVISTPAVAYLKGQSKVVNMLQP